MLDKIKNYFISNQSNFDLDKAYRNYVEKFFTHPFHYWILEDRFTKATFDELFDLLPEETRKFLVQTAPIYFLSSSGKYSCALSNSKSHAIIVFPELKKLLKSTQMDYSLSIILHELGHIIADHSNKDIDVIKAQVEADLFAAKLGFGPQIEQFLLQLPESMEKRVRLSYLTKYEISHSKK